MSPHLTVLAIPWGGPLDGRDLDGEYFSPDTETGLERETVLPTLWHHGKDPLLGAEPIGYATNWRKSEAGWICDVDLEPDSLPFLLIEQLAAVTDLFASSGADRSTVLKADGHIERWIVAELSLSTSPQNLYALTVPRKEAA